MKKTSIAGFLCVLLGMLCAYGYHMEKKQAMVQDILGEDSEAIEERQEESMVFTKNYIQQRRDQILQDIITETMSDYEKVKAIHDYLVTTASYEQPIGLEAWILYGDEAQAEPTYIEKRSSSILLYGFGYCEDYAAAMVVLLDGVNIPVRYIAGLGYAQGRFMDHAWNQVEVDGVWYHVDTTFDDSWSSRGSICYDYFLKGDATMQNTHRFGQSLLDMNVLHESQQEAIQKDFMTNNSPYDYPETVPHTYTSTRQDKKALQQLLAQDRLRYEQAYGAIDPQRYDATPPVFGNEGFQRP